MKLRRSTKPQSHGPSCGFTLIEVLVAAGVLALIAVNVGLISKSGTNAARTGSLLSILNGEIDLTIERMELALMAAHADEVQSVTPFPLYSHRIDFAVDVGVDDNEPILGDPERIEWTPMNDDTGRVSWVRNPGLEDERAVTWSRSVPSLHKDEVGGNNADDNGNGLLDEGGLAFTLPDESLDMVEIHLTVERHDHNGKRIGHQRVKRVTCRN